MVQDYCSKRCRWMHWDKRTQWRLPTAHYERWDPWLVKESRLPTVPLFSSSWRDRCEMLPQRTSREPRVAGTSNQQITATAKSRYEKWLRTDGGAAYCAARRTLEHPILGDVKRVRYEDTYLLDTFDVEAVADASIDSDTAWCVGEQCFDCWNCLLRLAQGLEEQPWCCSVDRVKGSRQVNINCNVRLLVSSPGFC